MGAGRGPAGRLGLQAAGLGARGRPRGAADPARAPLRRPAVAEGYLEAELIDHIIGRSYHPQGGGKVESLIGTVRRELWNVEHFEDRETATRRLAEFFDRYNEARAHMGIDGLSPADRFHGRADRVLAAVDAISRQRQGALALLGQQGGSFEELGCRRQGAPLEILRLVIVERTMELRFCGARVRLGTIEP